MYRFVVFLFITGCLLLAGYSLFAQPAHGDVFREYTWKTEKFQVLSLGKNYFKIPADIDLVNATRAEIALEIANEHLGFEHISVRMNDKDWNPVLFPEYSPKYPSPSLWFHHWYPIVPISLSDIKKGTGNQIEMKADSTCFDGKVYPNGNISLVPWCPVYGVTLRIYYDPKRKPHPDGNITSPSPGTDIGLRVPLKAYVKAGRFKTSRIDFVGKYEDVNFEGDGVYYRWHYHLFQGKITHHIGSISDSDSAFTWNTSWIPDQPGPIQLAAFITDESGLTYMTPAVKGIKLERAGLSVELCKPYEVPRSFTNCQYGVWIFPGNRSERFYIKGDLSKIIDARYVIGSWGDLKECQGYMINNVMLTNKPEGENWFYNFSQPLISPLSVLIPGENTFSTMIHSGRMPDIYMPGVQILIRYRTE